jgi:hypothetical protein
VRQFLVAVGAQMDTLHVGARLLLGRLPLVNLKRLVEADQDVPRRGLQQHALRIGDALLVAQDAVVVLLPHVDVAGSELVVHGLFGGPLHLSRPAVVMRLVLVVDDLVDGRGLEIYEQHPVPVERQDHGVRRNVEAGVRLHVEAHVHSILGRGSLWTHLTQAVLV